MIILWIMIIWFIPRKELVFTHAVKLFDPVHIQENALCTSKNAKEVKILRKISDLNEGASLNLLKEDELSCCLECFSDDDCSSLKIVKENESAISCHLFPMLPEFLKSSLNDNCLMYSSQS